MQDSSRIGGMGCSAPGRGWPTGPHCKPTGGCSARPGSGAGHEMARTRSALLTDKVGAQSYRVIREVMPMDE
ncbi:hypothetical protein TREES_T100000661 [Tupaia chinensis]|uniref:Uncharacterized protein n=1 Tax=Tupaia chinensis TaxID=246437 RepID=L9KNZ4_TUPCH|nr:hypothetical protein TREES_T100000661 [Tupaia chinensis]